MGHVPHYWTVQIQGRLGEWKMFKMLADTRYYQKVSLSRAWLAQDQAGSGLVPKRVWVGNWNLFLRNWNTVLNVFNKIRSRKNLFSISRFPTWTPRSIWSTLKYSGEHSKALWNIVGYFHSEAHCTGALSKFVVCTEHFEVTAFLSRFALSNWVCF